MDQILKEFIIIQCKKIIVKLHHIKTLFINVIIYLLVNLHIYSTTNYQIIYSVVIYNDFQNKYFKNFQSKCITKRSHSKKSERKQLFLFINKEEVLEYLYCIILSILN